MFRRNQKTRIREVNNFDEFLSLKDEWTELLQRTPHDVFSTWEWLSIWWRHFGENKKLLILLAEENGKLVGIAPLMYDVRKMFVFRRRVITFIGNGYPMYSNFIINSSYDECIQKFFEYLNNSRYNWNSVEIADISKDENFLCGLKKVSKRLRLNYVSLFVELPRSHEAFLNMIKRKDKKEFRRNLRRLKKAGFTVDLIDYSQSVHLAEKMDLFISLNQKRWNSKKEIGKCSELAFCNFCHDIAKCFSERGWLSLYFLELSGKPVASLFGFKYNSKYYAYVTGMDPEYKTYSVGNLLFLKTMEKCIQNGMEEFDFMGGVHMYKKQWNPTENFVFKASIPRLGVLSRFQYLLYRAYWSQGYRLQVFQKNFRRGEKI